jgi:hypothetical protein
MKIEHLPYDESKKIELMTKYSIDVENNKYVYLSHSFDTLEEALEFADEFINKIAYGYSPNTICA